LRFKYFSAPLKLRRMALYKFDYYYYYYYKKLSWCWQTRSMRLDVSQGYQTWYHSIC